MPSVSCSHCQTPNLSGAAYCRRCQRPLPVRMAAVAPSETPRPVKESSRPTEPVSLSRPTPARRPLTPFPVMSSAIPRETAPLPTPPEERSTRPPPRPQTMQSAPTQMLDLADFKPPLAGEDTVVGPLPLPPAPPVVPQQPKEVAFRESGANLRQAHVPAHDLSEIRALLREPDSAKPTAHAGGTLWPRKLVALGIDALLPVFIFVFWAGAEALLFSADWPEGHGDFLWSMAQWLHLHYGIGIRAIAIAGIVAFAHAWGGARLGRTLGQGVVGLRLVRDGDRELTWLWTLSYGVLSFWATLCCGANVYFMVVEKRQRTFVQMFLRADLVRDRREATPSFSLGTP